MLAVFAMHSIDSGSGWLRINITSAESFRPSLFLGLFSHDAVAVFFVGKGNK